MKFIVKTLTQLVKSTANKLVSCTTHHFFLYFPLFDFYLYFKRDYFSYQFITIIVTQLRNTAITARHYAFEPLTGIVTKVVYAAKAAGLQAMTVGEIEAVARKLKGTRKTAKLVATPEKPLTPEEEAHKYISASQLQFDSRIENLDKLIQQLKAQSAYAPNESELSVAGLTSLLDNMKSTNSTAIGAETALSNARLQRNMVFYDDVSGLVYVGKSAKIYIKSVFGPSSPEFKQVSKLQFKK